MGKEVTLLEQVQIPLSTSPSQKLHHPCMVVGVGRLGAAVVSVEVSVGRPGGGRGGSLYSLSEVLGSSPLAISSGVFRGSGVLVPGCLSA